MQKKKKYSVQDYSRITWYNGKIKTIELHGGTMIAMPNSLRAGMNIDNQIDMERTKRQIRGGKAFPGGVSNDDIFNALLCDFNMLKVLLNALYEGFPKLRSVTTSTQNVSLTQWEKRVGSVDRSQRIKTIWCRSGVEERNIRILNGGLGHSGIWMLQRRLPAQRIAMEESGLRSTANRLNHPKNTE